ncbi:unnamed protein product [marine sediment metagenome]|uniref:Uncharacterized protein n=1 Tax=marine sediment metagenome TaxID=412755 RepID=X1DAT0_9ZZZZ
MAVSEALIIAALPPWGSPSPALSVLLASLGFGCGIIGLQLARDGQLETAMAWDMASIMFDLLSIAKALEVI